jgi:CBS domain-containing protein
MNAANIMVKNVITVNADAKVKEAVKLMNENEIGCLIVESKGKTVGIVTERDLLKRVMEKSIDPKMVRVSEIMSKPLIVGSSNMAIEDVVRQMFKYNIKKLPIVEDGHLAGLITLTDIVRIVDIESLISKIMKDFKQDGWSPSNRMKKVLELCISYPTYV